MAAEPRRIILAVDATAASENAVTWAIDNFLKQGDHVLVLNAQPYGMADGIPNVDFAGGGEYAVPEMPSEDDDKLTTELAKKTVDGYMKQIAARKIACEGEIVRGEAGAHICSEAGRILADAVIMGTRDHGLLKRTLFGSISDFVLHNSPAPVVVVRMAEDSEADKALGQDVDERNVVVAVDGSAESAHAFKWALAHLCREDKDKLILLNIVDNTTAGAPIAVDQVALEEVVVPLTDSSEEAVANLDASEKLVEQYMKFTEKNSKVKCEGRVCSGPVEESILTELRKDKAHVVVVGSHDVSTFTKTMLGSVSDYLCHNSPCPVVVAKMVPKSKDIATSSEKTE